MNKAQAIEKIFEGISSHHDFKIAIDSIEKLNDDTDELFNLLWNRAIKQQTKGGHVFISALALYQLNISCQLLPEEAVKQVCTDWDVSIEEIPWYLANQFSKATIMALTESLSLETENTRLQTINYWIKNMN